MPPKVKLLKFVNGDAPQTFADAELTHSRLSFRSKKPHATVAKSWTLKTSADDARPLQGGYWLLDENNKPIAILDEVILALPEGSAATATSSSSASATTTTCSTTPRGVTDDEIKGVDLRSKLGRQLERARAEYGQTYKTASKSAREMMNAEEMTEKRNEKLKRDREAVAEAIESGEALPGKKGAKRDRTESQTA